MGSRAVVPPGSLTPGFEVRLRRYGPLGRLPCAGVLGVCRELVQQAAVPESERNGASGLLPGHVAQVVFINILRIYPTHSLKTAVQRN